jgi:hypothetical protein
MTHCILYSISFFCLCIGTFAQTQLTLTSSVGIEGAKLSSARNPVFFGQQIMVFNGTVFRNRSVSFLLQRYKLPIRVYMFV